MFTIIVLLDALLLTVLASLILAAAFPRPALVVTLAPPAPERVISWWAGKAQEGRTPSGTQCLVTLVAAHVEAADEALERTLEAKEVSLGTLRGSIVGWLDANHME